MNSTKEIAAGKFKATCLALLDEVQTGGHEIVVTKYGKPVAKVVPLDSKSADRFNSLRGSVTIKEDIVAPLGADIWGELE
ncbi:MAG TPA: type II toxin-antitoxin system prevent-host-death family antitoxin [Balneolaceae bacterium]|nr:type II toxin-antitoxin system prevent-host-death family antitoxin [Balneolaceae bacterium]